MKNNEEFTNEVFKRIEEYKKTNKTRRYRAMLLAAAVLSAVTVIVCAVAFIPERDEGEVPPAVVENGSKAAEISDTEEKSDPVESEDHGTDISDHSAYVSDPADHSEGNPEDESSSEGSLSDTSNETSNGSESRPAVDVSRPDVDESRDDNGENSGDPDVSGDNNAGTPLFAPGTVIGMIAPGEIPAGEFAGDIYRPEGYSERIGSMLAQKLKYSNDPSEKFSVFIWNVRGDKDVDRIIDAVNEKLTERIDKALVYHVEVTIAQGENWLGDANRLALLDREQIIALADAGLRLGYVGSGIGDISQANWETPQGINVYCELLGDLMVFDGDTIICYPDIWIE